jgi:hypothetical protein
MPGGKPGAGLPQAYWKSLGLYHSPWITLRVTHNSTAATTVFLFYLVIQISEEGFLLV